mmetsp:Transcript_22216/g.52264  ORF Transcript_22216/g.52264 Transcript_22216/m.52264 type:complete len:105 (-) Transcript_22216:40-354(-)
MADEGGKVALVLTTSVSSSMEVPAKQRRLLDLFTAKGVRYKEMDCSLEENREERSRLWGISGKRAVYPQVFIGDKFIGDGDAIFEMNEIDEETEAFEKAFGEVM